MWPFRLLIVFFHAVTLTETFDASCRFSMLLFTSVKRVAIRACVDTDFILHRACFKLVSTCCACHFNRFVFGMDAFFHRITPSAMVISLTIVSLSHKDYIKRMNIVQVIPSNFAIKMGHPPSIARWLCYNVVVF